MFHSKKEMSNQLQHCTLFVPNCICPNVSFLMFQAEDTRVQKAIEQILVEHSDILNRKTDGT